MTHDEFKIAAWLALNLEDEVPDWEEPSLSEIVETHEPIDHFRPKNVITGKKSGEEINTKYGAVVVRRGVQRPGQPKTTMFLATGENGVTLVGWE
jgi:hypothetical protein